MSLHDVLQDDPRFFAVGVNDQTFRDFDGNTSRSLILTAWYKGKVSDADQEEISRSIAKIVFDYEKNIDQYDGMQIKLTSAYDIGIASGNFSMWFSKSIEDWRKEIFPAGSPNG
jgi:hypothetical protein